MYSRNILQWRKIKTKARILPTGDYLDEFFCSPENDLSKMLLPKPDLSNSERFWNGIGRFLVTFLGSAGWTFLFLKNKPSKLKVLCMHNLNKLNKIKHSLVAIRKWRHWPFKYRPFTILNFLKFRFWMLWFLNGQDYRTTIEQPNHMKTELFFWNLLLVCNLFNHSYNLYLLFSPQ